MFFQRLAIIGSLVVALTVATSSVKASNWTIDQGDTYDIGTDADNAGLGDGDAIIIDGSTNTDPVTIEIDENTPILSSIRITAAVDVTIDFINEGHTVFLGNNGNASIEVQAGSLTVADTGGPNDAGKFDFDTNNTGNTLTIDGSIGGAVDVNNIVVGDNTLQSEGTPALHKVSIGGTNATISMISGLTVTTLTMTDDLEIDPNGQTLTAAPLSVPAADKTLTVSGSGTLTQVDLDNADGKLSITDDVTVTTLNMSEDAEIFVGSGKTLTVTNSVTVDDDTLTLSGPGTIDTVVMNDASSKLDVDANATINTLTMSGNSTIDLDTNGITLTISDNVEVGGDVLTLQGSGGVGQETLDATIDLLTDSSELEVNGNDLDNITGYTVNVEDDDAIIDVNVDTAPTAINMLTDSGDLSLLVATNKELDTTVDVNNNLLSIREDGTITTITIDQDDGEIRSTSDFAVDTIETSADCAIVLDDGLTLTVNTKIEVGAGKLELVGSGDGGQETIAGTIELASSSAELEVTGVDADELKGMAIEVTANGALLDTDINLDPTSITMTADSGDLRLQVASGKTIDATIDVNNNTLTLMETGDPGEIQFDTDGGVLAVNANVKPNVDGSNILDLDADATINVQEASTLTADVKVGDNTLTVLGEGTITRVYGQEGTVEVNDSATITILTPSPGNGKSFTYSGTGSSVVGAITAMDTTAETFIKAGTGSLTLQSGFSFASATGIKLNITEGTFIDEGDMDVAFGDDAEEIVVASGATFETTNSMTGHSGANTNLDAETGSTVNFTKTGTLQLISAANDDFKLLGTVNVNNACTLQLTGSFRTQWGDVNVETAAGLVNQAPSASMLFAPNSTLILEGTGSGSLEVNGQSDSTPITWNTTTGMGSFTFDRRASESVVMQYVELSNCTYQSLAGGTADSEIPLIGMVDEGNNTNWFSELTADAGDDQTIIEDSSVELEGSAIGASGSYDYAWSPETGLDDSTSATPTASPEETTTYTLTVSDALDPTKTDTDTVTITVVADLQVDAGTDQNISAGGSVTLNASTSGGSGDFTYEWTPTTGLDDATSLTPTASPDQTLTYTLTVTDNVLNVQRQDPVTVTVGGGAFPLCGFGAMPMMVCGLLGLFAMKRTWRQYR